jgi:NADH dehydrogenase
MTSLYIPRWRTVFARHRNTTAAACVFPRAYRLYTVKSGVLSRSKTFAKYVGLFCISSTIGIVTLGAGILVHDAFTYNERHIDRVPVHPLALHPERGGPKNLPIARMLVDDKEDEESKALPEKPKLVIVGAGWGVSFLILFFFRLTQGSTTSRP